MSSAESKDLLTGNFKLKHKWMCQYFTIGIVGEQLDGESFETACHWVQQSGKKKTELVTNMETGK